MSSASGSRRPLSDGEQLVLREVQRHLGAHNTEADVFFSDADEATIFARPAASGHPVCVVLTNLAAWLEDGTIESVHDLPSWLGMTAK
jgi:hypothetical protein